MSGLTFTDEAARHLEKTYRTKDIVAQRRETIRHLNLSTDEKVLDIGCGPGFLCEEMSEIVGRHGAVVGIDISPDLVELCARREHPPWLSYEVGDATKLLQPDASFDVVVCTQVAEYVADVDVVLSEAFRVLKPDGRNFHHHRLGRPRVVFRRRETNGGCFEIVGGALCPPASAENDATQAPKCWISTL
jgi:ubiquinone/menaquinone biosynthesis C-methylase UbiE